MQKGIIFSILLYIFIIMLVVIIIPLFSQITYNTFGSKKNIYEIHHETQTNPEPDISEYPIFEEFEKKDDIYLPNLEKPIIVLVIDDFGYSIEEYIISAIKDLPITVAIIPFLAHSKHIYNIAKEYKREIIVHLPMEAYGNKRNETNYVKVGMSKNEIYNILEDSFENIPGVGLNNHMGSKATEDSEIMDTILSFASSKNLLFLDSLTSPKSVGYKKAKEYNMAPLKRDVFLDNTDSKYYILEQLKTVEKIANEKGFCIAIGHARKTTFEVLKNWYIQKSNYYEFSKLKDLYSIFMKNM
ncbi:MAG: divergent polysaccharide deacetylase family protein [Brevinematales bacterium]|nr:divergent polysaccharide deacetylase family protein [Brevinematales bacterium]